MPICSICQAGFDANVETVCPNCGAKPQSRRNYRLLLKFCKTWALPLLIGGGLLGLLGQQLKTGLKPCNWIDLQLKLSGCIQTVQIQADLLGVGHLRFSNIVDTPPMVFSTRGYSIAVPVKALFRKPDQRFAWGIRIPLIDWEDGTVIHSLTVDETLIDGGYFNVLHEVQSMAFSPDGHLFVASIRQDNSYVLYLWETATGQRLWRTRVDHCPILAFSSDLQSVLCPERRLQIEDGTVLNLRDSDHTVLPKSLPNFPRFDQQTKIVDSPDQNLSAQIEPTGHLRIVSMPPATQDSLAQFDLSAEYPDRLYFSPNSQRLAIAPLINPSSIYMWNRGSDKLQRVELGEAPDGPIVWSPDGNRFGFQSRTDNRLFFFKAGKSMQ